MVRKFDGSLEPFDRRKVINTCLRMYATKAQAIEVANKIEKDIYDGITTKKILGLIFKYLKELKPEVKHRIGLREAISMLRPKPDFEEFVRKILAAEGYQVKGNQIVRGKCVEHEIDGIVSMEGDDFMLEIKHHFQHHTYTGVDVLLEVKSRLDDIIEGRKRGLNDLKLKGAIVVCNTKFSEHAKKYARCVGINILGWKNPRNKGLEFLIEKHKMFPITLLKMNRKIVEKLCRCGLITLQELLRASPEEIERRCKIDKRRIKSLRERALKIMP